MYHLTHMYGGAPLWAWIIVALAVTQEGLARSRFKSNTWVQWFGNVMDRARKTFLGRFPVVGQVLWLLAMPRTPDASEETPKAKPPAPEETPKARAGGESGAAALVLIMAVALAGLGLALSMAGLAGCATTGPEVAALRADAAASQSLLASYKAWLDLDRQRQLGIAAAATSKGDGEAKLSAWQRGPREDVRRAFDDAFSALSAYHHVLLAAGDAKSGAYGAALGRVVTAFAAVAAALNRHGIHLPAPRAIGPEASVGRALADDAPAPCRDEERDRWCPLITLPEVA